MRYLLQAAVMFGDLLAFSAAVVLLLTATLNPIAWLFVILGFRSWHKSGGFMAWRKKDRQQFMRNAKAIGL